MRQPNFIEIPAHTAGVSCTGAARGGTCSETVFWARFPSTGRMHPVSVQCDGGLTPTMRYPGRGVSHFSNCPDAKLFRATPSRSDKAPT